MGRIDLRDISLETLLVFAAVADHGGFSAAATATHRSQPRVSARVAELERRLGVELFDRRQRPVGLTREGAVMLVRVKEAIRQVEAGIGEVAAEPGELTGAVMLGSFPSASSLVLTPLMGRFGRRHPKVRFEIHEGGSLWLEEALFRQEVDIAVRAAEPSPRRIGLGSRPLFVEPYVVVAHAEHPAVRDGRIHLEELDGHDLITMGDPAHEHNVGHEYRRLVDRTGIAFSRRMVVSQPTTVVALVRERLGVGFLSRLAAHMCVDGDLVTQPLGRESRRQVCLFWNTSRRLTRPVLEFVRELQQAPLPDGVMAVRDSSPVVAPAGTRA